MHNLARLAPALLLSLSFATMAPAQKSKHKPKPKPKATQGVKGTAQLPGTVGQIGITYTLTPGGRPNNFTIRKLTYHAARFLFRGQSYYLPASQKALVIDYTVQNPNPDSYRVSRGLFDVTVVDPQNQNHKNDDEVMNPDTGENLNIELKPGQKVNGVMVVPVPAAGEMPKLMLDWGDKNKKVMRYDLHGKVGAVEEVVRDPKDPSGATSFAVVDPAKMGVNYPTGRFNINVEMAEFTTDKLYSHSPADKSRFLVFTLLVQNPNPQDEQFNYGSPANSLTSDLLTGDGDKLDRLHDALLSAREDDKEAQRVVVTHGEKRFRLVFEVPKDAPLKSLTLLEGNDSRKLVYDLSGLK